MDSQQKYKYDVFISYRSTDEKWVRGELLEMLEASGLKACIDFRDFEIGVPAVQNMERAVLDSRKTLLVLTPAYLKSGWTEFENLILQTLDPSNQQRRLIPLLKERSVDNTLKVWNLVTGEMIATFTGSGGGSFGEGAFLAIADTVE